MGDLDRKKLLNYLKVVLPCLFSESTDEDNLIIKKFSEGQSNPTYSIEVGNNTKVVLRRKPFGKLLKGAHQIEREYRIMKELYKYKFPVPKMLCICEDKNIIGSSFYIMEYVEGKIMRNALKELSKDQKTKCMIQTVKILANLHSFSIDKLNLQNYGKPSNYCKRVLSTWSRQYKSSVDKPLNEMLELIEKLEDKIDRVEDMTSIIHGDFSLMNIMYNCQQNEVCAILDWELSTIGHPFMDLAYLCMFYHAPDEYFLINDPTGNFREIVKTLPSEEELVRLYCKSRGINYPIKNWNVYLSLCFFKLASIIQGVYSRHLQGNASSPTAQITGYLVKPLVLTALSIIKSNEKAAMILSPSIKGQKVLDRVKTFLSEHVDPTESQFSKYLESDETQNKAAEIMKSWRDKAKSEGLWNLFLPDVSGLSNVDYAHIAEYLGRCPPYSWVFNCNAPDTGNMEVLHMYGSQYQKDKWLKPLMNGEISSAFCMTEPDIASSDATNMKLTISQDGPDHYIVNGRKWWSTGAGNPLCKFGIVMGRTRSDGNKYRHHSMIVVPFDTPGVKILRMLQVFGYHDAPYGHGEILFNNVRVPKENLILGEGRGFEIAQGRLGPGRIHHCMRAIGLAEKCLELFVSRTMQRKTFGKEILRHQVVQHQLAESRIRIDQGRLLTLNCANAIDQYGTKIARKHIAMIKVAVPRMLCDVIDKTIQVHGGAGVCQDFPLAQWYAFARTLRLADGPDEVHLNTIAKLEIRDQIKKSKL